MNVLRAGVALAAAERKGNDLKSLKGFYLKATPESGFECLGCAEFTLKRRGRDAFALQQHQ